MGLVQQLMFSAEGLISFHPYTALYFPRVFLDISLFQTSEQKPNPAIPSPVLSGRSATQPPSLAQQDRAAALTGTATLVTFIAKWWFYLVLWHWFHGMSGMSLQFLVFIHIWKAKILGCQTPTSFHDKIFPASPTAESRTKSTPTRLHLNQETIRNTRKATSLKPTNTLKK